MSWGEILCVIQTEPWLDKMAADKQWTDDEVLTFWEDPETRDLIINALPLECKNDGLPASDKLSPQYIEGVVREGGTSSLTRPQYEEVDAPQDAQCSRTGLASYKALPRTRVVADGPGGGEDLPDDFSDSSDEHSTSSFRQDTVLQEDKDSDRMPPIGLCQDRFTFFHEYAEESNERVLTDELSRFEPVSTSSLTQFPQQCVGKLFLFRPDTMFCLLHR